MNERITEAFKGFTVGGAEIPVKFLRYEGHGEPYVTWQQTDAGSALGGDDGLVAYVSYYDFDIYSRGNYLGIAEAVKGKMEELGFTWQPSRTGPDMYEEDTGYYHKTLNFAIFKTEEE